ncbi:MAG: hypothetical protein KF897_07215 [Opitutaceae bacterium]|nr:hypothetical protein [Opitutaceae bacterium]
MILAASLGLALLAAYGLACYFTGENLLAAWLDERSLRGQSLAALDDLCQRNPRRSGLVVTLTTIPSRIDALAPTLKSLLRQTAAPERILLCVPTWSEREQHTTTVPTWIAALRSVTVVAVPDQGPATKFLSTLGTVDPDQAVVVVDDDRVYHRRLLATYQALAAGRPDAAITAAGWRVPADLIDRPTTLRARLARAPYVPRRANQVRQPERTDIVQGVHSYLVRPRFFDLAALGDFSAAPAAVRFVDDVWISAHCRAEKWILPMRLGYTDYQPREHRRRFGRTSLGANVNRATRDAERGNSVALRHLSARWRSCG